ncbi:hypothetical protein EGW03_06165 [bacterium]|nr:hypothetical protein [bacterium]
MNEEKLKKEQLFIIDGQLIASILYILSFVATIIVIINQRKLALNKKGFLTVEESQIIITLNKIFILLLLLLFVYLNYKSIKLAENTNQNTNSLNLQMISSIISLVPALIGLYVVITDFSATTFQTAEIENPFA